MSILDTSAEDLATVDGIGKKTAMKIRWAVQEPPVEYDTLPHIVGLT